MEIDGARTLVAGATGVLGGALARALRAEGARVAVAGRSERLDAVARELGDAPAFGFEALDLDRCAAVVDAAADALGGLDLLVVAFGAAAFGPAVEEDDALVEELLTVDAMAPMTMVRAAVRRMEGRGTVAVLSAVLADVPTAGMAAYSASKAALSAWLTALRLEQRRAGVTVFDVRPPHIDTGLAERAIAGSAPAMRAATDVADVVARVVDGIRSGHRVLRYDLPRREFVTR